MVLYEDAIHLIAVLISVREPYDHHGRMVAELSVKLARAAQLPEADVDVICAGAHLHDIGKLLVDEAIVNADRRLTADEKIRMNEHTAKGWIVVNKAGYPDLIQAIVRSHHEHLDGSGYPDGLVGHAIPLAVRIVTICDCYAALTHKRPYRDAYSHNFAMAMIQKDRRKIFDAELVDLFFAKVARG